MKSVPNSFVKYDIYVVESGYAAAKAIEEIDLNSDIDMVELYTFYQNNTFALKNYMERQWNFVANMSETFNYMKL